MTSKLAPKLATPSYRPDPTVTQRRLEDLQRMFGMYTFPFSLSPNPARSLAMVNFSLAKQQAVQLSVLDAQGRIVYAFDETSVLPGDHQLFVPVSGLAEGIYLVRLQGEDGQQLRRLVVE